MEPVLGHDSVPENGAPGNEITPMMIEAGVASAMERLNRTELAWEYVDRSLMRELVLAALVGVTRASKGIKLSGDIEH